MSADPRYFDLGGFSFPVAAGMAPPDPGAPVPTQCRQAVAATIVGLNLDGIRGVYTQVDPGDRTNVVYPCVMVTTAGLSEGRRPGTNMTREIGYPVRVAILDSRSKFDQAAFDVIERWRYAIAAAFEDLPLDGVAASIRCDVEPAQIAEWEAQAYQHFVSGLVVRCWCRVGLGS